MHDKFMELGTEIENVVFDNINELKRLRLLLEKSKDFMSSYQLRKQVDKMDDRTVFNIFHNIMLDDKDRQYDMSDLFVPYLSDGQYQEAFEKYVEEVVSYYQLYQENGSNYQDALDDIEYEENKGSYFLMGSGIGLVVGLIVAFIVRSILVKQCNNVGGMKGSGCGIYGYFNTLEEGIQRFIYNS